MSLTSTISDVHSPAATFFRQEFPNVRAAAGAWRPQLAGAAALYPPTAPVSPPWAVIGHAIDYRIRYYFAPTPVPKLVAGQAMNMLWATIQMTDLFQDQPALRELWGGDSRYLPVGNGANWLIPALAHDFCTSLEQLIFQAQPAGRRLPLDLERPLCQHCYILALFEQLFRSGLELDSPLYSLAPDSALEDLLALAGDWWVEDLCQLSSLFYERCSSLLSGDFVLNPTFAGSRDIGGADADLIVDRCLIDIKTTVAPKFDGRLFYQLLGYVLLDYVDAFAIKDVGVYFARQGVLVTSPLEEFILLLSASEPAPLPRIRERFREVIGGQLAIRTKAL